MSLPSNDFEPRFLDRVSKEVIAFDSDDIFVIGFFFLLSGRIDDKNEVGFDVEPVEMDLSSRESIRNLIAKAKEYGEIKMLVNGAGVSPFQAPLKPS